MLDVWVGDDGRGGADIGGGGLRGLVDRIEALGGTVTVESPADAGTRLHACIPLVAPEEAFAPPVGR